MKKFDFKLEYWAGGNHKNANSLSRMIAYDTVVTPVLIDNNQDRIKDAQGRDEDIVKFKEYDNFALKIRKKDIPYSDFKIYITTQKPCVKERGVVKIFSEWQV
ncbi:hypothetical protein RF11_09874 [Thelohanellus kitauei]|uniref:Uncharacterized protein n=1 Tax=Thelohanellus kitauei TaxID=669202 RepID=A0A0C2MX41_THEKT|nr:hypothetical protein RF11_09874 [Thelohanellus kitauei]